MGLIQTSHEKKIKEPQLFLPISTKTYLDDNGIQWEFVYSNDNKHDVLHISCKKYPFIHANAIRCYAKHRGTLILNEMIMIQSYMMICGPPYIAEGGSLFSGMACIIDVLAQIQNNPDLPLREVGDAYREWVHESQPVDLMLLERFYKTFGGNILKFYKSRDIAYKTCLENKIFQLVIDTIQYIAEQHATQEKNNG